MRTIKIFLASSEELALERAAIADLVDNLNFKLRTQDIFIQLVKWEYLDSSMGPLHKQEEYNRELRDCELCMVLYWTRFGMYTKTELDTAYHELCAGRNPKKLYIYFKDSDEMSPELKAFRDGFPSTYGHFYCHFPNVDTLKADFLLQFMEYLNVYLKDKEVIVINDSQVSVNGKVFVNLQNVPFAGNNEEYNLLLKTIKKTKKLMAVTETDDPEYAEYADELSALEEKRAQMESSLWETALMVTKLSTTHCSERLARAMDLFNNGDNKGATAILDEVEIEKDIQHNLRLIELGEEGKKGIKTNIDELLLKIKTLQNDAAEGWLGKALELYGRCIALARKNIDKGDFARILSDYGDFLTVQRIFEGVEEAYHESLSLIKELPDRDDYVNMVLWNQVQLSEYYITSREFKKAEDILDDSLKILEGQRDSRVADTLNHLAVLNIEQLDYDSAEKMLKQAITLLGSDLDDDARRTLQMSRYQLAYLYHRRGDYLLEEKEAQEALRFHQSTPKQENESFDDYLFSLYLLLGNCYESMGRLEESESMFLKGLDALRADQNSASHYDSYQINKVCCLCNLSRIHRFTNHYEQALAEVSEAHPIIKELFGQYPVQYAAYYAQVVRDISLIMKECGRYDEALGILKDAVNAYDIILATEDQQYRISKESCMNLLGCIYLEAGRYEEARDMLCKTKDYLSEIISDSGKDYYGSLAQILTNLGYLETNTRHYDLAEKYYSEVHDIFTSEGFPVKPDENGELALLELNMGWLYQCQKKWEKAKEAYFQSIDRLRSLKKVRDRAKQQFLILKNLVNISSVALDTNNYEDALKYAFEAKETAKPLYTESPDNNQSIYYKILNHLAWILYCCDKPVEAETDAKESLSLARRMGDEWLVRQSLDTNACIQRSLGNYAESESLFLEAIEICERFAEKDPGYKAKLEYEREELAKLHQKMS